MKIAIYANLRIKNYQVLQYKLSALLKENNLQFAYYSMIKDLSTFDILITIGGDGTVLQMVEIAARHRIKILPIHAGTLGCLSEFDSNQLKNVVTFLKKEDFYFDNRSLLECQIKDKKFYALNEFVVQYNYAYPQEKKLIAFDIFLQEHVLQKNIVGNGVIVSTPTGSTAYSLSAGGAILFPELSAFLLTPLVANSLNSKPIVYADDKILSIHLTKKSGNTMLLCDGNKIAELLAGEKISIYKSLLQLTFLREKKESFFQQLEKRTK